MGEKGRLITGTICALLIIFCAVVYSACNKPAYNYTDPCANVTCMNNGVCITGKCDCTAGFTGPGCEKKVITPYLGKWNVTQQVIASNNQAIIGTTKNYDVLISEDAAGVTLLKFSGILGDSTYIAGIRVGFSIGYDMVDSVVRETDIPSTPARFVFKRYQSLGGPGIQLLKGEGTINELGTQMSGEFYITYPDPGKGAIEDRIIFSALYKN